MVTLIEQRKFSADPKNRLADPSENCALDFKHEFRRYAICSVPATIDIDRPIFDMCNPRTTISLAPEQYRQRPTRVASPKMSASSCAGTWPNLPPGCVPRQHHDPRDDHDQRGGQNRSPSPSPHGRTRMIVFPGRRSVGLKAATASSRAKTVPMFVRSRPSRTRWTISFSWARWTRQRSRPSGRRRPRRAR
jgi:hypothetical protein